MPGLVARRSVGAKAAALRRGFTACVVAIREELHKKTPGWKDESVDATRLPGLFFRPLWILNPKPESWGSVRGLVELQAFLKLLWHRGR